MMFSLIGDYGSGSSSEDENESTEADKEPTITKKVATEQNNLRSPGGIPDSKVSKVQTQDPLSEGDPATATERSEDEEETVKSNIIIEDEDDDYVYSASSETRPIKYLAHNTLDSDDSDSNSSDEALSTLQQSGSKMSSMSSLDNPFRVFGTTAAEVKKEESVFQIQFLEDEHQKTETLQKHVKMTSDTRIFDKINGKKVCWNFRKGKCRFGHNCTFAHDSDLLTAQKKAAITDLSSTSTSNNFSIQKNPVITENPEQEYEPGSVISSVKPRERRKSTDDEGDLEESSKDHRKGKKSNRKRPGLTQNLVPGKKIMNAYFKNKSC